MFRRLFLVAPLLAAPIFSQAIPAAADPVGDGTRLEWFQLTESPDQVRRALGHPALTADFGADFLSWQFQIGDIDHHDFSRLAVFRKSTRTLVSITRNYEPEIVVDKLFPAGETATYHFPNASKPEMSVRVRRLSEDRLLIAKGAGLPGQTTNQIVLIRRNELRYFFGWLDRQMTQGPTPPHSSQR
ncbi:MAG TPA: hypothetical protein VGK29_19135 [Paludibaculum sp.]|jgi:hypothetical protein